VRFRMPRVAAMSGAPPELAAYRRERATNMERTHKSRRNSCCDEMANRWRHARSRCCRYRRRCVTYECPIRALSLF